MSSEFDPVELESLLWRRLDGDLGDADRQRLESWLVENPEARALEREVAATAQQLESVESVQPPPWLESRIRREVAERQQQRAQPAWRRWLGLPPAGTPVPRRAAVPASMVAVAAALIAVAIAVFMVTFDRSGGVDPSRAVATMGAEAESIVASSVVPLAGHHGELRVARHGNSLSVTVELVNVSTQARLLLTGPVGMRVTGWEASVADVAAPFTDGGDIGWILRGAGRYHLEVTGENALSEAVHVSVVAGYRQLAEWSAAPGPFTDSRER